LGDSPKAVDSKMATNELVREGAVVICDHLIKECQHILEKKKEKKEKKGGLSRG
jgi:hypothetical protein